MGQNLNDSTVKRKVSLKQHGTMKGHLLDTRGKQIYINKKDRKTEMNQVVCGYGEYKTLVLCQYLKINMANFTKVINESYQMRDF